MVAVQLFAHIIYLAFAPVSGRLEMDRFIFEGKKVSLVILTINNVALFSLAIYTTISYFSLLITTIASSPTATT